jgi:uncharacterized membrane protein
MESAIPWIALYLAAPALVIAVTARIPILRQVQPVISCYILGLVLGNTGILPGGILAVQDTLSSATVALSIPLMLFGVDIRNWTKLSRRAGLALLLAAVAIVLVATVGHFLFRSAIPESAQISGLLVGVYTGGTPNLAAIKNALGIESSLYVTVHTADLVVGGVYLLFVLTLGKALFSRVLPTFELPLPVGGGSTDNRRPNNRSEDPNFISEQHEEGSNDYAGRTGGVDLGFDKIFRAGNRARSALSLALAAGLVGVSLALSLLFSQDAQTVVVILGLTTFAILLSLIPAVGRLHTSFKIGEYVILVFCVVVGSMANLKEMLLASPAVLGFVAFAVFASFGVHLLLCKLFRVDVDTMLITSTAAICSPPFVGMVGIALGNRRIIAAGITSGIIGYAIGNYLGVAVSYLLSGVG